MLFSPEGREDNSLDGACEVTLENVFLLVMHAMHFHCFLDVHCFFVSHYDRSLSACRTRTKTP